MKNMQDMQLSATSKVNQKVMLYIIELIVDRTSYVKYSDIHKQDLEDLYLRPFYLNEDKLFIYNIVSAIALLNIDWDEKNLVEMKSEVENLHRLSSTKFIGPVNWTRLTQMLKLAEIHNVSAFSVFYEWVKSSCFFLGIELDNEDEKELEKVVDDIMRAYSD